MIAGPTGPRPAHRAKALGERAEEMASSFFTRRGYGILRRNYRVSVGEVDLILDRDRLVIFVEVKARMTRRFGLPQEAVTPRKQRQIIRVAQWYLQEMGWLDRPVRFDVMAILFPPDAEPILEHIPGAFEAEVWRTP